MLLDIFQEHNDKVESLIGKEFAAETLKTNSKIPPAIISAAQATLDLKTTLASPIVKVTPRAG
ncbi:hypothetical protein [uncultured Maribacter sp.]|uniref:hypothetical protein n=1 Tax=uncultured Maribacter sp. TaxID=431308 RepID=UPI0030DC5730|tara:strand:+ start:2264 stop:2452 length:189 start_codon:yes stop_codon:yes gene_type:complete